MLENGRAEVGTIKKGAKYEDLRILCPRRRAAHIRLDRIADVELEEDAIALDPLIRWEQPQ